MWKDYSYGFIKNNRAFSGSILAAAFISALFLAFLCSLFYNLWVYEIEAVVLKEGDWQGRLSGEITDDDLRMIQNFGNIDRAVINEELSEAQNTVVDLYFQNAGTIFEDLPALAERLSSESIAAEYHLNLLSNYLIHDPQDETPPLLLAFYLVILAMVSLSLILIIHNSFALSMNGRIHQFGIFSSIGATPGQIRICLMQEAVFLCAVPVLLGSLLGTLSSFGVSRAMDIIAAGIAGRHELNFQYHPMVFVVTILFSFFTVLCSAWLPARKLSRMTPLEAIRNTGGLTLKKKKHSPVLSFLFGIEGELAGNALKAQKKALRTSTLSLTLSFLGFTLILCFFTLSGISTRHTYYERYQDTWDVMVTVKGQRIEDFGSMEELKMLEGVKDCVAYQKAEAVSRIPLGDISTELAALGGPEAVAGASVTREEGFWLIKAPIVIMDDAGFAAYCEQIGITPQLEGAIILNRIWDSQNSNFRYRSYIPYIKENKNRIVLQNKEPEGETTEIKVSAYTREAPVLREEYDNYTLVQFVPLSLWKTISAQTGVTDPDTCIRFLGEEGTELFEMNALENHIKRLLSGTGQVEIENRIQEKIANDKIIMGFQLILGGLCALLALIGIANLFSNTLGFLRQRKQEFARYMSIGMTPAGMRKMFLIEALVIAGRPLLITFPITVAVIGFMIKASFLNPAEFIAEAPVIPSLVFCLVIVGSVALAFYIGGKRLLQCDLSEELRNDAMV